MQQHQQRQQQHEHNEEGENTPDECASLRSLARSCEAAAVSETDTAAPAGRSTRGGERHQDGGGGGGRVGRARDAAGAGAAGDGDGNSDDGRDRVVPVVRRSSTAVSGRTEKSEGAGRRSSSTGSSSGRKSCSSGLASPAAADTDADADADDCADEMREVKLEAALLCGIGRAPARRSAPTNSAIADKGLGIVSLAAAAAAANAPSGDNKHKACADTAPRSSSSSPGRIRGDNGDGGSLSRTSSAPHLPSLSIRHHHSGDSGGGGGGSFRRPSSDSHPMDRDRATRGHGGGGGGGNTLPPMAQMPGSPSACGETDSDHSDSMGGGGGGEDPAAESKLHQRRRAQLVGGSHGSGFSSSSSSKAPSSTGRDSWPGYSRRGRHVASARDNEGLSCA